MFFIGLTKMCYTLPLAKLRKALWKTNVSAKMIEGFIDILM